VKKKNLIYLFSLFLTLLIILISQIFYLNSKNDFQKKEIKFLKYTLTNYKENINFLSNTIGREIKISRQGNKIHSDNIVPDYYLIVVEGIKAPLEEITKSINYINTMIMQLKPLNVRTILFLSYKSEHLLRKNSLPESLYYNTEDYVEMLNKFNIRITQTPVLLIDDQFECLFSFLIVNDNILPMLKNAEIVSSILREKANEKL